MSTKNKSTNTTKSAKSETESVAPATTKTSKTKAVKEPKIKKEKPVKVPGKRGRKADPNSKRAQMLAARAEIIAKGGVIKRGRPANPNKVVKPPFVKKVKPVKEPKVKKTITETPAAK